MRPFEERTPWTDEVDYLVQYAMQRALDDAVSRASLETIRQYAEVVEKRALIDENDISYIVDKIYEYAKGNVVRMTKEEVQRIIDDIGGNDKVTVEECLECFGTGYWKGFGAPCSRGCKGGA